MAAKIITAENLMHSIIPHYQLHDNTCERTLESNIDHLMESTDNAIYAIPFSIAIWTLPKNALSSLKTRL